MLFLPLLLVFSVSCSLSRDEIAGTGRETKLGTPAAVNETALERGEVSITGALSGPMSGGVTGYYTYDMRRTQAKTNKAYGYAYDRGTAARIESATIRPRLTKAGDRIDLKVAYVVLTHSSEPTLVRETREISYGENLWGSLEVQVERTGGTYESNIPLYLPDDLRPGTYKVRYIVQTPTSRDVRETNFTVQLLGLASPPPVAKATGATPS